MQKPSEGPVLPVLAYFKIPNRAQILQIMVRETEEMIQNLQLIISHHIRPHLSVMTI